MRHTSRANNENVPWVYYCKKREAEKNLEKPKPLTKPYTSIWCQDAFGRCVFCGTRCLLSHCLFLLCAQQGTALAFHNTTTFERTQYRISIKKNFKNVWQIQTLTQFLFYILMKLLLNIILPYLDVTTALSWAYKDWT